MYVSPVAMLYSRELKVWLRIKTSGEEIVYNEYRKIKEFREKRRKEEELEKQKQKEYEKYIDILIADVKKNPENYKNVNYDDLPKEIQDSWSNLIESDYVKYEEFMGGDLYKDYYNVYINKRDLSDGYLVKIIKHINLRSGYHSTT